MPSPASPRSLLRAAAVSHPGLKRGNNEDRYHCDPSRGLFMVVDGVGGQAAGETAAETARSVIRARLERETGAPLDRIREAITLANNEVLRLAQGRAEWQGMACVLTVALVRDGVLSVGHVGDTRLYVYDQAGFRKVTHDHSPIGEREDQGDLDEAEAMRHPRRNEIFRDVGSEPHEPLDAEFIEAVEVPFERDAALLICSDGLSDLVPSAEMARLLARHADSPDEAAQALVDAANREGGKDNVTVIVACGASFASRVRDFPPPRRPGAARGAAADAPAGASRAGNAPGTRAWARRGRLAALAAAGAVVGLGAAALALVSFDGLAGQLVDRLQPPGWSRTWHVGPDEGADAATISEALRLARPGDRIEVAPGTYREALVIKGEVHLAGTPSRGAVLEPPESAGEAWTAVRVERGATGSVSGLTIRPGGARPLGIGVQLFEADLELLDLDISGAGVAGIIVETGARATVRASYIHGAGGSGVVVRSEASPQFLHNVIADNGKPGAGGAAGSAAVPDGRGGSAAPRPPAGVAGVAGVDVQPGGRPRFFGNIIADNAGEQVRGLTPDARADLVRDNIVGGPGGSRREAAPAAPRGSGRGGAAPASPPREGGGR